MARPSSPIADTLCRPVFDSDSERRARTSESLEPAPAITPTIGVHSGFLVSTRYTERWIEAWRALAAIARTWPGCRHFRLDRDRDDGMYFVVYSEWDDPISHAAFERDARVRALEEELTSMSFLEEARFLDVVPMEPGATYLPDSIRRPAPGGPAACPRPWR